MPRTPKEKVTDQFLAVYLMNDAFSRVRLQFMGETKLQKLVFLSERSMISERMKGFNFRFIKFIHGPYSQELRNNLGTLLQTEFINDFGLAPTDIVKMILEDFQDVIKKNQAFLQQIKIVNDHYAKMPLEELLKAIYAMPFGGKGLTIADLPLRRPMLYPLKPDNVKIEFELTNDEVENLLMNFDARTVKTSLQAMKEMRTGGLLTHEQVFSDL
jgi:uncharacterized protein YwgA